MNKSYKKMKSQTNKNYIIPCLLIASVFYLTSFSVVKASEINPENVGYLINQERIYYGLHPLKSDETLGNAAFAKTEDMINRDYFEHYAFGLSPWNFINNSGYNYLYAGENLAMDFNTAEGVVKAWMNSPLHRYNILNPDYEDIGVGVIKGAYTEDGQTHETIMVTNMFGRKKPAIIEFFNNIVDRISQIFN